MIIPLQSVDFKGPYADHILIPQGTTGSSTFFISNETESLYFSIFKSKNFNFKFFVVLEI